MLLNRKALHTLRITADLTAMLFSFLLVIWAESTQGSFHFNIDNTLLFLALALIWVYSSRITGLYDEFRSRNFSFELVNLIKNIFVQSLASIILIFFVRRLLLSRLFAIEYSFVLMLFVWSEKYLLRKVLEGFRHKGRNLRMLLIVGAGDVGQKFFNSICNNPHLGYKVLGFLDDDHKVFLKGKYIGPLNDLRKFLEKTQVDDVIVALPNHAQEKMEEVISVCEDYTTRVRIIPDYFKFLSNKYSISMFGRFPIISVRDDRLNELHWRFVKRTMDLVLTVLLFVFVFSWLWPIITIAIKLTSKGPVFFKQERWGRDNKKFVVLKFRTMYAGSKEINEYGEYQQATKDDPRITKIGKILRKTNLDELPQFFNVLKGDMSIVGPRPHPIPLNNEVKGNIKNYMQRHLVKPGITGWAQVNGFRGETRELSLMEKRVEYDMWYIENWSFWLDLQIIIQTVWNMIKGDPNAY